MKVIFVFAFLLHVSRGVSRQDAASLQLVTWASQNQGNEHERTTDSQGLPYPSLTTTESVLPNGPVLLSDNYLLERHARFNRERVQERVVHAKGTAAHGKFTVTHDITRWTKANFLNQIGKETPVFLRFSTTSGEMGTADTAADTKGFAVKFYTQDGLFDITGNQIEVFNTRDPNLFADVNKSRQRNPQTHVLDKTAAWDFIQARPETIHHLLKRFSDLNFPESLRMINGSGIHTFKLVNANNEPFYCKFHFISHQKFKLMSTARASLLGGSDPSYYQRDLYNAITTGNFPKWTMAVQVATVSQAVNYRWDYLDITKNWRFEDFPLHPVGILELNRMPVDFFAETEQAAFSPGNLVIGIEPSEDRMLHARMFSYPDAQRYRLGINYNQIPVNRPLNKVVTYERDGQMCVGSNGGGGPNYFPNSFLGSGVDPAAKQLPFILSGTAGRIDTRDADNFSQAILYLEKDITKEEKQRIADRFGLSLSEVVSDEVIGLVFQNVFRPLGSDFESLVRSSLAKHLASPPQVIPERA